MEKASKHVYRKLLADSTELEGPKPNSTTEDPDVEQSASREGTAAKAAKLRNRGEVHLTSSDSR